MPAVVTPATIDPNSRESHAAAKARAVRDIFANHGIATAPGVDLVPATAKKHTPSLHSSSSSSTHSRLNSHRITEHDDRSLSTSTRNNPTSTHSMFHPNTRAVSSSSNNNNNNNNSHGNNIGPPQHHSGSGSLLYSNQNSSQITSSTASSSELVSGQLHHHHSNYSNNSNHSSAHAISNQHLLGHPQTNAHDAPLFSDSTAPITTVCHVAVPNPEEAEDTNVANQAFVAEVVDDYVYAADVVGVDIEEEEEVFEKTKQTFIKRVAIMSLLTLTLVVAITVPTAIYIFRPEEVAPTTSPTPGPTYHPTSSPTMEQFVTIVDTLAAITIEDGYYAVTRVHPKIGLGNFTLNNITATLTNSSSAVPVGNATNTSTTVGSPATGTTITINMTDPLDPVSSNPPTTTTTSTQKLLDKSVLLWSSPQYKAIEWLTLDESNFTVTSQNFVQRYVLAVLYFSLEGDEWTYCSRSDTVCKDNRQAYLSSANECEWFGNKCEDTTVPWSASEQGGGNGGRITQLKLPNNNLQGTLPTELGMLTSLEYIYLNNNAIAGVLPSTLASQMTRLLQIRLEMNQLQGPLPDSFFDMAHLKSVSLRSNRFGGTIPTQFGRMRQRSLEKLYLHNNLFTGSIPAGVFGHITAHSNAMTRQITQNATRNNSSITTTTTPTPSHSSSNSKLKDLYLSHNHLTGTIPEDIFTISSLQIFDAGYNKLSGVLSYKIGALPNLKTLVLSNNSLMGKIPTELFDSPSLENVDLSVNELYGPIGSEIGNLQRLKRLQLFQNALHGTVPTELGNCTLLVLLTLHGNDLQGTMPQSVCNLRGTSPRDLQTLSADCSGDVPRVNCSCCNDCGTGEDEASI